MLKVKRKRISAWAICRLTPLKGLSGRLSNLGPCRTPTEDRLSGESRALGLVEMPAKTKAQLGLRVSTAEVEGAGSES